MQSWKKISLSLAILFGMALVVNRFVRLPFLGVSPVAAVPRHAAVVLSFNQKTLEAVHKNEGENALADLFLPAELSSDLAVFTKIFGSEIPLGGKSGLLAVMHPAHSGGFELLFILDGVRGKDLTAIVRPVGRQRLRTSIFRGNEVFHLQDGGQHFAVAKYRNLLLFGRHAFMVENAISQLESPSTSLCRDDRFSQLARKLDPGAGSVGVLANFDQFESQLAPLFSTARLADVAGLGNVANWLLMELPTGSASGTWRASLTSDPQNKLLAANEKGDLQPYKNAFRAIPDNLALVNWLSIGQLKPAAHGGNWRKFIAPWAGNELVFALGEPMEGNAVELFLLLKTNKTERAEEKLAAAANLSPNSETVDFQMFKLRKLDGLALGDMLGLGEKLNSPFAAVIGEYTLFSNSRVGVERWLEKYVAGQTCSKNVPFLQSIRSLPHEAQGFFFFETGQVWQHAAGFLDEGILSKIGANPLPFKQLTGVWERKGGRCDMTLLHANLPSADTATPADILWKVQLGAAVAISPMAFKNPQSGEMEVFVQDANHIIYLLSKTGRLFWQRRLDGPILSKVYPLDLYGNSETQFAFSTASGIHVVDHFGEDVAGFPLKLQTPATNGVTVVDFFNSNDYCFFIACGNGNAYGFDEKGSPIEGWRPKTGVGEVRLPLVHFQAQGKDFLILLDVAGNLQVFQKNGEKRFNPIALATRFQQAPDFQADGGNFRIVACDTAGGAFAINLAGEHFKLNLLSAGKSAVGFRFADVVGDNRKDYAVLSEESLKVSYYAGKDFKTAFEHKFDRRQDEVFPMQWGSRSKAMLGTVCREHRQINLLNDKGELLPQFPLAGTTSFQVVDLLGEGKPVALVGNGDSVYAYLLMIND